MKLWKKISTAVILFVLLLGSATALAFQDTKGDPAKADITQLYRQGIINGVNENSFVPQGVITWAQGVQIVVRAFDLNLDAIRFVKHPVAADYFDHVDNSAWYSEAFIVAFHNGIELSRDLNPNDKLTEAAYIKMLKEGIRVKTSADTNALFENEANDNRPLTRSKAATLTVRALRFVQTHDNENEQVSFERNSAGEGVDRVTLTWPNRPNAGYGILIESIDFPDDSRAIIHYSLHEPVPGSMYAQVITDAKASTFVPSGKKIELQRIPKISLQK